LNAVPLNLPPAPSQHQTLKRLHSIDDILEEDEEEDEELENKSETDSGCNDDHGQRLEAAVTPPAATHMTAVICQCQQLLPFHILSNSFEDKCSAIFQVVYKRSRMSFNERTKAVEVQVMSD
jgi:hypothetical protein